ncbi:MAG: hypothetical protein J5793_03240 [Clostridia bacterium]|nr:hypothetical protein [Clostridia bacterium]
MYTLTNYTATNYGYSTGSWGDLLTNYNGTAITYDSIGNPTKWRGISSLTWNGRKLTHASLSSGDFIDYSYNNDGLRTQKSFFDDVTSETTTHKYLLDGSTIVKETVTGSSNYTLNYFYDESGVTAFDYNGTRYYYVKNLQGDIIVMINIQKKQKYVAIRI